MENGGDNEALFRQIYHEIAKVSLIEEKTNGSTWFTLDEACFSDEGILRYYTTGTVAVSEGLFSTEFTECLFFLHSNGSLAAPPSCNVDLGADNSLLRTFGEGICSVCVARDSERDGKHHKKGVILRRLNLNHSHVA